MCGKTTTSILSVNGMERLNLRHVPTVDECKDIACLVVSRAITSNPVKVHILVNIRIGTAIIKESDVSVIAHASPR